MEVFGSTAPSGTTRRWLSLALAMTALAVLCEVPLLAQDDPPGKAIYLAKCAKCHGATGVPRRIAKGAPNLSDPKWDISLEQVEESVRDGKGKDMLGFKAKLSPEQIRSVSVFVQTLNEGCADPCAESKRAGPK